MKKIALILCAALGLSSANAFAGDASNINWICSERNGEVVTLVSVANGEATLRTYMLNNAMMPLIIGGPYKNLITFGGGDFVGVKSTDGSFSLIAGSLTATLNDGATLNLNNVACKQGH